MKLTCVNNHSCNYIQIGKEYKIIKVHNTGITVKNDNNESVFYPNKCFGLGVN